MLLILHRICNVAYNGLCVCKQMFSIVLHCVILFENLVNFYYLNLGNT